MLEFFRRYIVNKYVLAVGAVLLMVVFLLPAGGQIFMPNPAEQTVGTVDGEPITAGRRNHAASELDLLKSLFGRMAGQLPEDPIQWLLLQHEARRHGIYTPRSEARSLLRAIATQMKQQDRSFSRLLQSYDASKEFVIGALRGWLTVRELRQLVLSGPRPSAPRMRHLAQDIQSRATVRLAGIDAGQLLDNVEEPSQKQLKQHFAKYKDQAPGESEPYGFGYKLPDRVKLAYIAVPLKRVRATVQIDEVRAQRFYKENRERYIPEPGSDGGSNGEGENDASDGSEASSESDTGSGNSGQEASRDAPKEPKPYTEVREQVMGELRRRRANEKQQEIIRWLVAQLNENVRPLEKDDHGYRIIPEGFEPLRFEELAERVEQKFGVLPDVVRIEDRWLSMEEVGALDGFGAATLEMSGNSVPVTEYISRLRAFRGDDPTSQLTSLRPQVGVASRAVTDPDNDRYIFRALAADPAHVPESLEEVRPRVQRDLKRLEAYRLLKERADKLIERAKDEGLEAVAESFETQVEEVGPFSGRQMRSLFSGQARVPQLPVVGRSEPFVRRVFDLAQRVQREGGVEEVPEAERTIAVPVDGKQLVALTTLTDYQPVDTRTYEQIKPRLPQMLTQAGLQQSAQRNPMSLQAVAERVGFRWAEGYAPDAEPQDQPGAGTSSPRPTSPLH